MKIWNLIIENKKYVITAGIAVFLTAVLLSFVPQKIATIKIDAGSTPKQVAKILKKENIITSENIFLTLVWLTGTEKNFQTGIYKFSNRMNEIVILYNIVKGRSYKIKVTVPEGYTSKDIAELLERKGICSEKLFLEVVNARKLEGYLFPETYFLIPESPEEYVASILNSEFEKKFTRRFLDKAKDLKMTREQIIILASIIEKEAKDEKERPLISAVFHNRLKKGWHLESCATVMYAIGEHRNHLTLKDTKISSPFNTYLHPGLPPAPICNPGIASIKAALYPVETEDMFFVADGSGTHKFSKYFEEHSLQKGNIRNSRKK